MFRKILLAYDGSTGAKRALEMSIRLALMTHAEIWALAVEEHLPHFAATIDEMQEEKVFANHYYEERLEEAYQLAHAKGISLRRVIRAGHVARTIIEFVKEENFDVVVLGRSGHSGAWAMFLGTTAEKVSRHVPCHVLLVK